MASKKKEIRKASEDLEITKKEKRSLKDAGVSSERLSNYQAKQEAVGNVGKKFDSKDFKALQDSGLSNNKVLKVAASSRKVNTKASNKLSKLNPGIKMPSRQAAGMDGTRIGGTLEPINRLYGGLDALGVRTEATKSLEGLGKKYLQWQGTDAKGKPQALGGYKVPKKLRKPDKNNPLSIQNAMGRSTFNSSNGSGTLFGRDGSSILKQNGKMKNAPASWMPPSTTTGGSNNDGGGKGGKNKNKNKGLEFEEFEEPTSEASSVYGGSGTDTYGSATLRKKKSRAQTTGTYTQGPSRLGSSLQRESGLNIMRA
jgi:hypothetical protein